MKGKKTQEYIHDLEDNGAGKQHEGGAEAEGRESVGQLHVDQRPGVLPHDDVVDPTEQVEARNADLAAAGGQHPAPGRTTNNNNNNQQINSQRSTTINNNQQDNQSRVDCTGTACPGE